MSQDPNWPIVPPTPPMPPTANGGGYWPYMPPDDPRKRAARVQWVITAILLLGGCCMFFSGSVMRTNEFRQAMAEKNIQLPPGVTVDKAALGITWIGGLSALAGVAFGIGAVFVRRGVQAAINSSMVLSGLLIACMALQCVSALMAMTVQPVGGLLSLLFFGGIMALLISHIRLLSHAKRQGPAYADALAMQQMQYWMMMQQPAPGQADSMGYGYGQAGAAQPLPPPPPSGNLGGRT